MVHVAGAPAASARVAAVRTGVMPVGAALLRATGAAAVPVPGAALLPAVGQAAVLLDLTGSAHRAPARTIGTGRVIAAVRQPARQGSAVLRAATHEDARPGTPTATAPLPVVRQLTAALAGSAHPPVTGALPIAPARRLVAARRPGPVARTTANPPAQAGRAGENDTEHRPLCMAQVRPTRAAVPGRADPQPAAARTASTALRRTGGSRVAPPADPRTAAEMTAAGAMTEA
jgi:hypothetical protein